MEVLISSSIVAIFTMVTGGILWKSTRYIVNLEKKRNRVVRQRFLNACREGSTEDLINLLIKEHDCFTPALMEEGLQEAVFSPSTDRTFFRELFLHGYFPEKNFVMMQFFSHGNYDNPERKIQRGFLDFLIHQLKIITVSNFTLKRIAHHLSLAQEEPWGRELTQAFQKRISSQIADREELLDFLGKIPFPEEASPNEEPAS